MKIKEKNKNKKKEEEEGDVEDKKIPVLPLQQ